MPRSKMLTQRQSLITPHNTQYITNHRNPSMPFPFTPPTSQPQHCHVTSSTAKFLSSNTPLFHAVPFLSPPPPPIHTHTTPVSPFSNKTNRLNMKTSYLHTSLETGIDLLHNKHI
ncbi:hypothetical protein N7G274_001464 [Stereocaulon virgatum]|uniref:Uncharacterized protein n=1 Tax=Stereocaulon virgatum TaxID=373712 RepID=A0ABR4AJR6_9LECA